MPLRVALRYAWWYAGTPGRTEHDNDYHLAYQGWLAFQVGHRTEHSDSPRAQLLEPSLAADSMRRSLSQPVSAAMFCTGIT
jgi:hypothetical protein